jgi:hypothetical protein
VATLTVSTVVLGGSHIARGARGSMDPLTMVTAGGIRLARFRSVTLVGCNKHRQIWQWHVGIVSVAYFGSS